MSLPASQPRDSLIETLLRGLDNEKTRSMIVYAVEELVGTNNTVDAIRKLCVMNETSLLRILTIMIYGADPLYGRTEVVRRCHFVELPSLIELHFEVDGGTVCVGLTKGNVKVACGCRSERQQLLSEDRRVGGVEVRVG